MMKSLLLVGLGGGLGSIARYLCQRWLTWGFPNHFPWGTFAVNIIGCGLIGILWSTQLRTGDMNVQWKLFLMTGLCGGFTTFSAFTLEGIGLLREQKLGLFLLYTGASIILCLLATFAGTKIPVH